MYLSLFDNNNIMTSKNESNNQRTRSDIALFNARVISI
nr:MAG TPA: hypothetical protein [Caudoviricetes sp.]